MDAITELLSIYPAPWPPGAFDTLRARLGRVPSQERADAIQDAILAVLAALSAPSRNLSNLELVALEAINRKANTPGKRLSYSKLRDKQGRRVRYPTAFKSVDTIKPAPSNPDPLRVPSIVESDLATGADPTFDAVALEQSVEALAARSDPLGRQLLADLLSGGDSVNPERFSRRKRERVKKGLEAVLKRQGADQLPDQKEISLKRTKTGF